MAGGTVERRATSPQFSGSKKKCAFERKNYQRESIFEPSTRLAALSRRPLS